MLSSLFHPVIAAWFAERFGAPTAAQEQSWPAIVGGEHTLVAGLEASVQHHIVR